MTEVSVYSWLWLQSWPIFFFFKWNSFITIWLLTSSDEYVWLQICLMLQIFLVTDRKISENDWISGLNFGIMLMRSYHKVGSSPPTFIRHCSQNLKAYISLTSYKWARLYCLESIHFTFRRLFFSLTCKMRVLSFNSLWDLLGALTVLKAEWRGEVWTKSRIYIPWL